MLTGKLRWLSLAFCMLWVTAHAQEMRLEPGKVVEREIASGESHAYQISLTAGQFARFRLEQRAIDAALTLTAPDGKQLVEMNLTRGGEQESLSVEAAAAGLYRVVVRYSEVTPPRGSYRLEASVQAATTQQDRKRVAAESLLIETNELGKQGGKTAPQAIEKLEQAVLVWREMGEPIWVAWSLNKIGRAHVSLNQNDKAIGYYEQALAINQELKYRYGEGAVLNNLGNAYFNLRQFPKAIEAFEKSLALFREVKERRWEGLTIYQLGNVRLNLNEPEKAIACFEQALPILREVKDKAFEAQALKSLGLVYRNWGQIENAIAAWEASIAIFREVKDQSQEGQTLNNLATAYSRLGRSEKAIEILNQALALSRALKDRTQEGNTLRSLGGVYGGMGQTEKAIEYFLQGLAISREIKDRRLESLALSNLGLAYTFLSQYEKAIEYLVQALPITRETNSRDFEGGTLSNLGISYTGLGRYEKAIESLEQALTIFRERKDRLFEGNTLQSLGNVYKYLRRDDKAIEYYNQTLAIFREAKYRVGEGNVLGNLGNSYSRILSYDDAIRSHEQALAIYRELKYRPGEAIALTELGEAYAWLNQPDKASEFYEQALSIHREVKSREFEGATLLRMGQLKQKMRRTDDAVGLIAESVAIFHSIGDRNQEFGSLTALAKAERERGNLRRALTHVEESLRIAESLRTESVSPESRSSFLAAVQESYQVYTDLLMRRHRAEPAKGFDALALEVGERQHARSLLDLLTEANTDLRKDVDPALVERERTLAKQLNDKARTQTSTPEQAAALKLEISQLENDYERAQVAIRKANPRYAALTQPQPLKLKEIQAQLDADTLLLEYSLGEERSYLWAITRDSLTSYELPKSESIDKNARQVHELLSARSTNKRGESSLQRHERIRQAEADLPAAAHSLSQMLLAPAAAQLGNKRLVIVADGALQYIPFAMLPDPVAGSRSSVIAKNQPLVVNHEIVSLPSASALAIQRAELAGRQPAPKMLAVIADPVFDRTDARLKSAVSEASDKTRAQTIAFNDARSIEHLAEKSDDKPGVTTSRMVIPRLPFTRQEATQLLALTPKQSSFGAIDFQATRETVLKGELSQYRYVHFATHGLLDSERPGLSSLVLSMVDEKGQQQDGFLRANDIYNLKLPAELVVLSACQTGLGKEIKGEGLVGLTRGFMYAGAARVVVSLWSVNDKATSELMTKFYEKMLKRGERPAAALRAAQVEMWRQKQWQSPYYWAAFTLQGEWR